MGGIPLDVQRANYDEAMKPWPQGVEWPAHAVVNSLTQERYLLRQEAKSIGEATDLAELQNWLVIRNVNEFLLSDEPTLEQFEQLVEDFGRWCRRTEVYLGASQMELDALRESHKEVQELARNKFRELRDAKH